MSVGDSLTDYQETILSRVLGDLMGTTNARAAIAAWLGELDEVLSGGAPRINVVNNTGGTVTKGTQVFLPDYAATEELPELILADANVAGRLATHVVCEDIGNGLTGEVATTATLDGLNTSAYAEDDDLFLSATAGAFTDTDPGIADPTAASQFLGVVETVSATAGRVRFFPGITSLQGVGTNQIQDDAIVSAKIAADIIMQGTLGMLDDEPLNVGTGLDGSIEFISATPELLMTVASAALNLSTTTAGDVNITAADDINLAAAGSDIDMDSATLTVDLTGAASIDAVGASNLTTDNGDLTIQTITAGQVIIDGVGGIDIDTANALAVDVLGNGAINIAGTVDMDFGDATDITTTDITAGAATGATALIQFTTGQRHLTDAAGSPVTGGMTIQTGDSIVDIGAGAATGGQSGDMTIQTGDTNCDDALGTAGPSGALTIQTGDADSNAGTSGDSGILTLASGFSDDAASGNVVIGSGAAGTDSGDLFLDVGAAGGTPGDVVIGTTATRIQMDSLVRFDAAGGADAAAALLGGVGTTGSPATTAAADQNFLEFRTQSSATSGDARGLYMQLDQSGIGGGGDAVRGRALVTANGTGGTLDGGSFTLEYNGGQVAGQGLGGRMNVVFPDSTVTGGTVYGGMSEFALGGTSFVNNLTAHALHSFSVIGGDAATRNAQVLNLFDVSGVTSTSGGLFYANNAATPANHDASFRVVCPDDVVRHIMLYNTEA